MAAKETSVNVYGINLTAKQRKEWAKREPTTWLEMEIPRALNEKLVELIGKEIEKYKKNKK